MAGRLPTRLTKPLVPSRPSIGSPIGLYATASIDAGEFATPNVDALRNPLKQPIEIHEIRFSAASTANVLGSSIEIDLALGAHKVTGMPVAAWLFGRSASGWWENNGGDKYGDTYTTSQWWGTWGWRLSKPLVVLPGEVLTPTIYNKGLAAVAVNAGVSYLGRTIDKAPVGKRWLPYVVAYSATKDADNVAVTFASGERDLANLTDSLFYVERIGGRLATFAQRAVGGSTVVVASEGGGIFRLNSGRDYGNDAMTWATTISLRDARGVLIADQAPYRSVIEASRRTWETQFVLPPRGYIMANIAAPVCVYGGVSTGGPATMQAGLSLVGYREVPL